MAINKVKEDVWIKTFCHGCLSAMCGLRVHRVNGVVVSVEGDPDNPYNRGRSCARSYAHIMTLYDPNRPMKPLVRTNPEKGKGVDPKWKEVEWDEALDLAAKKLAEVRKNNPTDLLFSSADISAITWVPGPILLSYGSPNYNCDSSYWCAAAVHTVPYQTQGTFNQCPDYEHCKYLILWGSNKGGMLQHLGVTAAIDVAEGRMNRGTRVVVIDPYQAAMGAKANEWVPIRPGTDLAMALAVLHVLLNEEGVYDEEFLKKYTNAPYLIKEDGHYVRDEITNKPMMWDLVDGIAKTYDSDFQDVALEGSYVVMPAVVLADGGTEPKQVQGIACRTSFELLKDHVKPCTPEWAEPITTIPAANIRRLAKEWGKAAQIGSTIQYEGHTLPYRPLSIHWYCGISQHANAYATGIGIQLIMTVLGCLGVPGGPMGESAVLEYPHSEPTMWTGKGAEPGEVDGIINASAYARFGGFFQQVGHPVVPPEPPKTHLAGELFPVGMSGGWAIFDYNNLHPERFNHKIPRPKLFMTRHGSDVTNHGNPDEMIKILKDVYQISCEPMVDETAELADIFLPVPVRLERLQIGGEMPGYGGGTIDSAHFCINYSYPASPTTTKEMLDIWGELSDRIGIRGEFNQMTNFLWDLQGENRLEGDTKYTYREMQERFCKTLFGPKWNLENLKDVGHIKWRKNVKERYPRVFTKPRTPIYYEHFIGAGEQMTEVLKGLGFEWDLRDYVAMPMWRPLAAHREKRPEFNLYAIPFRVQFLTHQWLSHNPWLMELAEAHPTAMKIVMNASTAAKMGIKEGDRIEVEGGPGYKVENKVHLTQCIHPEVIAISRHGGHWARKHKVSQGKGNNFNTLIPHNEDYIDPLFGGLEGAVKVKITRINSD